MFRLALKRVLHSLIIYLATGCSKEEMFKVRVYEFTDIKISVSAMEKDDEQRPLATLKNFAASGELTEQTYGDTFIYCRCNSGCDKVDRSPGPILKTYLRRIDLYSNRDFGPDHPSGTSLNSFLYFNSYSQSGFPKPVEELNSRPFSNIPSFVLIDAPDTVKGLTLFIWNLQKSNGQVLTDSSWVVLQ